MLRFKDSVQMYFAIVCCVILIGNEGKDSSDVGLASNRVDVTAAQPDVPDEMPSSSSKAPKENGTMDDPDFNSFKAAFLLKRSDQRDIVQRIKEMKEKKKDDALKLAIGAILKSLAKSRQVLMQHNYQIGEWPAIKSTNESSANNGANDVTTEVRSSLSSVIENVAFLCDIVLFFPDHVHERLRLRRSNSRQTPEDAPSQVVKWAFTIANVGKFIFSEKDRERMNLALQELQYIPRGQDFTNPNSKEAKVEKLRLELEKKRDEKKNLKEKEYLSEKARLKKLKYDQKMKKRKREEL